MPDIVNYHKLLEKRAEVWRGAGLTPSVLLHSCCAPCSSTCLEVLTRFCRVTVFYFNPNITSKSEYEYRLNEQKRLIAEMPFEHPVDLIEGRYEPDEFLEMAKGLETAPERGPRCVKCYTLRLKETALTAKERGFDYFATTLTLSPLKPAPVINEIGLSLGAENSQETDFGIFIPGGAAYLPTDFKKNEGYKRSIELSKEYGLYRQNFCGCDFSKPKEETAKNNSEV
ncbi:MAG: epoxyqueuosine reductase QueH [Lachnospiraceae bacterium]|nr:epoxyqueuosine reductase QueH [Lachnospiraceae bacterium]